jgi:predicted CXXCH cytochrome family protein
LPGVPLLKNAEVILQPGGYRTHSDSRGVYTLNDIPPATYLMTFSAKGYEDFQVENVRVLAGQALFLDGSLFPVPKGAAKAALSLTTAMGVGRTPQEYPYNTTVYLDAGKSHNLSGEGIRWEIYGPDGTLLYDPYDSNRPYTPKITEMPKASPFVFTFVPPGAGKYTIRLYVSNPLSLSESRAEITVEAVNVSPEAYSRVYAGPLPPQKAGSGELQATTGLSITREGEQVYLRGYALDRNYPTPVLYNPGGNTPDIYGKNDDHYQRAFSWQWQLELDQGGKKRDVSNWLLRVPGENNLQHVYFTALEAGTYHAMLTVNDNDPYGPLESERAILEILVLPQGSTVGSGRCLECHSSRQGNIQSVTWNSTVHGKSNMVTCEDCHGPGEAHIQARGTKAKRATIGITHDAGLCGRCHSQYNQWEKSLHSDGYAFGHLEIARPLLLNCVKCHYAEGFIETTKRMDRDGFAFKDVAFRKPLFPGGPVFFDFNALPQPDASGITCVVCHNPHGESHSGNSAALRLGSAEALCASCHAEKWHNVLLLGKAGETGSAFEYPGNDYPRLNYHLSEKTCVLCHMAGDNGNMQDAANIGGHTLRMRSKGNTDILGGYGPRPDHRELMRGGEITGNQLLLNACRDCHGDLSTFNVNRFQEEIYTLWLELGELLRAENSGVLPGYRPGDKCATCHRGGTLPFENDSELILENAYTNYKLIGNDRSWGIHNPGYVRKLLTDSIQSLQRGQR